MFVIANLCMRLLTSPFQTLARTIETSGIALHAGTQVRLRLLPTDRCGLFFVRTDLVGAPEIAASPAAISHTTHATTLQVDDASVSTTEHLLAALWMNGITHCRIELDGPEVPILDGSARDWCRLLADAGSVAIAPLSSTRSDKKNGSRPVWNLRAPVYVEIGNSSVLALPHDALRVSVWADFGRSYLAPQLFDAAISPEFFAREIAPARTFTLEEWIEPLRAQGLIRGGTTENAIVLGEAAPLMPLRFDDELARHKILDLLGDIALLCAPDGSFLNAHFIANCAGHALHQQWMMRCLHQHALVSHEE